MPVLKPRYHFLAFLNATLLGLSAPMGDVQAQANEADTVQSDDTPLDLLAEDDTLADLDIMALMDIEVVSVSGQSDMWFTTPAALTVITPEDIANSGFQELPEVFRLVPGMNVGRITASRWAIGTRGFNEVFTNNLQVSVDGLSVYNQEFGGVAWELVDVILEDLEQIEVVRGPGATLWGNNAANGVINVRTKNARDTQGWLVTGGTGTELRGLGQVRYGGQLGQDSYFRVWTKYINHDSSLDAAGNDRPDDFDVIRGGFRADGTSGETDWMLSSYIAHSDRFGNASLVPVTGAHATFQQLVGDYESFTANLLGQVRTEYGENDWSEFQISADTHRRTSIRQFTNQAYTFNAEYRRHLNLDQHQVLFGVGYRYDDLNSSPGPSLAFIPSDTDLHEFRGFIQDTYTFADERWKLMIGSKFEHNDYTGFELQPSARMSYARDEATAFWGAISRPVIRPNRTERDTLFTTGVFDTGLLGGGAASGVFVPATISGNPNIDAVEVYTGELGYRKQASPALLVDLTAFYQINDGQFITPIDALNTQIRNSENKGYTWGFEAAINWEPSDAMTIAASYSYYGNDYDPPTVILANDFNSFPRHQAQVRMSYDLSDDLTGNLNTYFASGNRTNGNATNTRMDLGLTWRIDNHTTLSLWGQNLLDESTIEATDSILTDGPTEVQRGVFVTLTKEF